MGEPCNGNEMCASGTCAENESGSLVCAEKAWEEHWFNVKWLLRLMVILSGVLILGGRRVR